MMKVLVSEVEFQQLTFSRYLLNGNGDFSYSRQTLRRFVFKYITFVSKISTHLLLDSVHYFHGIEYIT